MSDYVELEDIKRRCEYYERYADFLRKEYMKINDRLRVLDDENKTLRDHINNSEIKTP